MAEGKEIDVAKEVAETAGVVAAKEIFIYYELVEFLKNLEKDAPSNKCYKVISSSFSQEHGRFIIIIYACLNLPTDRIHDYLVDKYKRVMRRQEAEQGSEEVKFTKSVEEVIPKVLYNFRFAIKNPIHDDKKPFGKMIFQ